MSTLHRSVDSSSAHRAPLLPFANGAAYTRKGGAAFDAGTTAAELGGYRAQSVRLRGRSPIKMDDARSYSLYTQVYSDDTASDRWLFAYTKGIETVFSTAASGVLWLTAMVLFSYFVVAGFWLALLSIDVIDSALRAGDFTSAVDQLGFIIAFITRDQISSRMDAVVAPLAKYHAMLQSVRTLEEDLMAVYRTKLIAFERVVNSRYDGTSKPLSDDMKRWIAAMHDIGVDTITNMQLLALWCLRVFLKGADVVNDYAWYGVTELEVNYSRELPETEYGYESANKPIVILRALLRRLKEQIGAASEPLDGTPRMCSSRPETPAVESSEAITIQRSIHTLEDALNDVERVVQVSPPRILPNSMVFVLVVYILVILPLIVYIDISGLSLIFTPIILILYSLPLVLTWYTRSPFDPYPHWGEKQIYSWRRSIYKMINHDNHRFQEWIGNAYDYARRSAEGARNARVTIVPRQRLNMLLMNPETLGGKRVTYQFR